LRPDIYYSGCFDRLFFNQIWRLRSQAANYFLANYPAASLGVFNFNCMIFISKTFNAYCRNGNKLFFTAGEVK